MKKTIIRTCICIILSLLLGYLPIHFLYLEWQKAYIREALAEDVQYIDNNDISIYRFPNRTLAQKASIEATAAKHFEKISIIPKRPSLFECFSCADEPEIEYIKNGTYQGIDKYRASIKNFDSSFSFHSYQLSEYFVENGLIKLIEGRMLDFNKKDNDCIEILVTEGLGLSLNDEVYATVSGLDENRKQIVVKAKIVGIVEKGAFLYGSSMYCDGIRTPFVLYNYLFHEEIIFTSDISYLYQYETEPNSLLDEDIPVFLLGTHTVNDEVQSIFSSFSGEEVTHNVNHIEYNEFQSDIEPSNDIIIAGIMGLSLIIIVDVIIIKKFIRKARNLC